MAKFDVYRTAAGELALDCQANTVAYLNTRLAVPLVPREEAPIPAKTLNPVFRVAGEEVVMVTQFAASLPTTELRQCIDSLAEHEWEVGRALDLLISGY